MTKAINNKQQKFERIIKENFQNQHIWASMPMYCIEEMFNVGFFIATCIVSTGVLKETYIELQINAVFLKQHKVEKQSKGFKGLEMVKGSGWPLRDSKDQNPQRSNRKIEIKQATNEPKSNTIEIKGVGGGTIEKGLMYGPQWSHFFCCWVYYPLTTEKSNPKKELKCFLTD